MSKKVLFSALLLALIAFAAWQLFAPPASQAGAYGRPIDLQAGESVSLAAVLANPLDYEGRNVIIEAKTGQVCRSSGCWLILTDGSDNLQVQFYDFTVFLNSNQLVRVQGEVRLRNQQPYLVGSGVEVVQ